MTAQPRFITAREEFIPATVDSDLRVTGTIVSAQSIPTSFLDRMAATRQRQDAQTFAQLTKGDDLDRVKVASIPVAIVAKWDREGFDLHGLIDSRDPNAIAIIMAKLDAENLSAFRATSKDF